VSVQLSDTLRISSTTSVPSELLMISVMAKKPMIIGMNLIPSAKKSAPNVSLGQIIIPQKIWPRRIHIPIIPQPVYLKHNWRFDRYVQYVYNYCIFVSW